MVYFGQQHDPHVLLPIMKHCSSLLCNVSTENFNENSLFSAMNPSEISA